MMKAILVDFDDSFTYNLVQELVGVGLKVDVVHWKDLEEIPSETLLVLGPGPGHPDDYQSLYPLIDNWMKNAWPLFGVCLGHQIIWRILGEEVIRSKNPLHGQKIMLDLSKEWQAWLGLSEALWVQRYNSLAVMAQGVLRNPFLKNHIQDEEILITSGKNLLSYQFHPESVGTSFRKAYFLPILRDLSILP